MSAPDPQSIRLARASRQMNTSAAIRPTMTRLQVSALVTLLDDLDRIALGVELMPDEFWLHVNAAAAVLSAELVSGEGVHLQ